MQVYGAAMVGKVVELVAAHSEATAAAAALQARIAPEAAAEEDAAAQHLRAQQAEERRLGQDIRVLQSKNCLQALR